MKRDRTVAPGSTIEDGGAMLVSPSRVSETGSGTGGARAPQSRGRLGRCRRVGGRRGDARSASLQAPAQADQREPEPHAQRRRLSQRGRELLSRQRGPELGETLLRK